MQPREVDGMGKTQLLLDKREVVLTNELITTQVLTGGRAHHPAKCNRTCPYPHCKVVMATRHRTPLGAIYDALRLETRWNERDWVSRACLERRLQVVGLTGNMIQQDLDN